MEILLTGIAGFIGFHTAKSLLDQGHKIIGIDNINDYYCTLLKKGRLEKLGIDTKNIEKNKEILSITNPNLKFYHTDITDKENIYNIFKNNNFDAVIHLAAQAGVRYSIENPSAYISSNITGPVNILECIKNHNIKNFIFASSSSVYGLNKSQPFKTSDETNHPISLYAATKKSLEMITHSYSHLFDIPSTGIRFFTVYGPWGRPDMAPMLFLKAILEDKEISVFNHGNMSRDFTYIDDIVNGIIKILNNPAKKNTNWDPKNPLPDSSSAPFRIYNLGNSAPINLNDFIITLEKEIGITAKKILKPMQAGDVATTYADMTNMQQNFNYHAKTNITHGIKEFVNWYKEFYAHHIKSHNLKLHKQST